MIFNIDDHRSRQPVAGEVYLLAGATGGVASSQINRKPANLAIGECLAMAGCFRSGLRKRGQRTFISSHAVTCVMKDTRQRHLVQRE